MGGNQKRPAGSGGSSQGNSKRKKKYTQNGKAGGKVHQSTLHEKSYGVLVTVERYKKAKAQRELIAFLNEGLRKLYPDKFQDSEEPTGIHGNENDTTAPTSKDTKELTLEEELAAEIASAKQEWKEDKGTVDGVKSLVTERVLLSNEILFYQFPPDVQPEHFTREVFARLKTLDVPATKFCHRMLPVTKVCKSNMDSIRKECVSVIQPHFHNSNDSHKFSVMFKCKYNDVMKKERMAVITAIADIVDCPKFGHKVDLDHPEKIIFVEILEKWCLMSVVDDYEKYRKYNLMSMTADLLKTDGDEANAVVDTSAEVENAPDSSKADPPNEARPSDSGPDDTAKHSVDAGIVSDTNRTSIDLKSE